MNTNGIYDLEFDSGDIKEFFPNSDSGKALAMLTALVVKECEGGARYVSVRKSRREWGLRKHRREGEIVKYCRGIGKGRKEDREVIWSGVPKNRRKFFILTIEFFLEILIHSTTHTYIHSPTKTYRQVSGSPIGG